MSCGTAYTSISDLEASLMMIRKEQKLANDAYLRDIECIAQICDVITRIPCLMCSEIDTAKAFYTAALAAQTYSYDAFERELALKTILKGPEVVGCVETIAKLKEEIAEFWRLADENVKLARNYFIVKTKEHPRRYRSFSKFTSRSNPYFIGHYTPTKYGNFRLYIGFDPLDDNPDYNTADHILNETFQLQFVAAVRDSGLEFVDADPILSQNFDIKAPATCDVAKFIAERELLKQREESVKSQLRELGVRYY